MVKNFYPIHFYLTRTKILLRHLISSQSFFHSYGSQLAAWAAAAASVADYEEEER
jgi:hypothetical protein